MNIAYNMDCIQGMKDLLDESIDLTVTSPPYDNIRTYNGFSFDWKATLEQLYRITKIGGVVVWIVNDQTINGSESGTSFRQALYAKEIGFNLHDTMIWNKGSFSDVGSTQIRYAQTFEYMFILSKGKPKTFIPLKDRKNIQFGKALTGKIRNPDGTMKKRSTEGKRLLEYGIRFNVWDVYPAKGNELTGHPAQFPYQLAYDHIRTWSDKGDTVLDPFLGSGTTRLAAYDLCRDFIGYEISKEYFDKEEARFEKHISQLDLWHMEGNE